MPHQEEGVAFLERASGRALLADEMGLGKTRTTIEYLRRAKLSAVVVTTKSFLYGWKEEISRWWPEVAVQVHGKKKEPSAAVYLITYDMLSRANVTFSADAIVFDESHKLMNPKTKRSEAARGLARGRRHVICLTGTPQPNGQPQQLWHQMLLVGPRFLTWSAYRDRFCDPQQVWAPWANRLVWDYTGASNLEQLRELIAPRFLRRTKEILNLPALTTQDVILPVTLKRKGDEAWKTYEVRLEAEKVKHALVLAEDCVERGSKVLVFTGSKAARDEVWAKFAEKAVGITAGTPPAVRSLQVKKFQEDPDTKVFVATCQIAAEGLTLTAADVVIVVDLPWSPGTLEQVLARSHRKGQTKPVHAYFLVSDTPFDRTKRQVLADKQSVTEAVLEQKVR